MDAMELLDGPICSLEGHAGRLDVGFARDLLLVDDFLHLK